ncbi:MAG: beta-ketoacyl-[acyl-carrier-protein] synthase family protein [Planctomycetaceae bacterium]|nr:beta-ketoacyl-[acyl-carrier-protein] synthase family protein [Planctomycetaceae bacterium]
MSEQQSQRRIVITGIGIFSPIGIGVDEFRKNLLGGMSGVRPTQYYHNTATPGGIGGEVLGFDEKSVKKEYLSGKDQRKSLKMMCREIQLGAAAALQALTDSGIDLEAINHARLGVEYGANLMFFDPEGMMDACRAASTDSGDFAFEKWGGDGLSKMEPLWMLKYLPNMPACHIAIFTDSRGPNNSVTLDEASPGVVMTEALNILERGAADMMLVGGTGTRLHPVRAIHAKLFDPLGYDEAHPEASCRPFDVHRTGQVVGEGAACLMLEEEEHAKARGARIYGRFLSGGSSCVLNEEQQPDQKQAILNAVGSALRRAGMTTAELGHINAHGLGTEKADRLEAAAYRELLGEKGVPVTGLKGHFGNAGAATGFFELIGSLLSLKEGQIPKTLNCEEVESDLGIDVVTGVARAAGNQRFLNVNFTRLGQASAVIVEA